MSGRLAALKVKPVPETLAAVSESEAVPELVTVTVCVDVPPTATLPKARLAGATERAGSTPVPASVMTSGEFGALLVIASDPLAAPGVVGV